MPFYIGKEDIIKDLDAYLREHYVEGEFLQSAAFVGAAFEDAAPKAKALGTKGLFGKKSSKEAARCTAEEDLADSMALGMPMADRIPSRTLDDVILDLDKSFMEMVFSFADARDISDVELQKRANLDRKAFSKLKCGTTKNPSKATALALAIALQLNLDDTKDLLSRAGFALSPCSRQDLIVQYFIEHEAYDIHEINIALYEHGEESLGVKER